MELQPKGNTNPKERYHVPSGIGKAMIHAGLAEEVLPEAPKFKPNLQFSVRLGAKIEDYQEPPYIYSSCSGCSHRGTISGPTAHKTFFLGHCGEKVRGVPEAIAKRYVEELTKYNARKRKLPQQQVSQFSSPALTQWHGVKSREELIAEYQAVRAGKK